MSCTEVMYQAYYPYLYQRPSSSPVSRSAAFPPFSHQYDRQFGVQRSSTSLDQATDVFGGGSVTASAAAGSSSAGTPSPVSTHSLAAPQTPVPQLSGKETTKLEEEEERAGAQYVSANCVVFTHYSGDVSSVVDEHFSRALSQTASYTDPTSSKTAAGKETSPMSARNFPPSFWNCNYQAATVSSSLASAGLSSGAHPELYPTADPYHPADPWHYQPYSHRAVHEFTYNNMAASGRFNTQYGSLLLPPGPVRPPARLPMTPQYAVGKASDAWTGARLHEHLTGESTHPLDTGYGAAHAYGSMAESACFYRYRRT